MSQTPDMSLTARFHRLAMEQGFALAGATQARPSARGDFLRRWLASGRHGEMAFLADPQRMAQALDPTKFVPGAKAVLCVADAYNTDDAVAENTECASGRIARYAWGPDYHETMKRRLRHIADVLRAEFPQHVFRVAVDTAPVLEKEHAARAGLGFIGRNTLLINPIHGSWLTLGEIVTTAEDDSLHGDTGENGWPSADAGAAPTKGVADRCGCCTRCIDACPTRCLSPRELDASRCIAYLTIEKQGDIEPELRPLMGEWLAGCDVCQEVCPFNKAAAPASPREKGANNSQRNRMALADIISWDESARRAALSGSTLKRVKLTQWRRNAQIVLGNKSKSET